MKRLKLHNKEHMSRSELETSGAFGMSLGPPGLRLPSSREAESYIISSNTPYPWAHRWGDVLENIFNRLYVTPRPLTVTTHH